MSAMDFVKKHPVAIGISAVVVLGGFVLLSSGGSDGGTQVVAGQSDAEIAAGVQLQQLQYQQQMQGQTVGAQRDVALAETAAQLELGKLQIAQQSESDKLAASTALAQINASSQTAQLQSTLQAQTSQAQIAADSAKTAAMMATIAEQARQQANVAIAGIRGQVDIAKINKPKQGLFSKIFG